MVFLRCNWLPLPILYCPNLFIRKQLETINTRRIARDNKTAMRLFGNKGTTEILQPGFYGLSNAELGARWPKCIRGAQGLAQITASEFDCADLIGLLHDSDIPADDLLPHRGRPIEMERRVAPSFIVGDDYGTRASTCVMLGETQLRFMEQSYHPGGISADLVDFAIDL